MIVGRSEELEVIDRLLDEAREGRSACLVLRGEPGIGKTSLLDAAAERASGLTVLRARGVELEAELPYSGLLELLRPILADVDRLPEPQAAALRGALALGPTDGSDRFAACAATLGLLAAVSEGGSVLVLVDDAQWLDSNSGEALAFAARRLRDEGIAMLWTVRTGDALSFSLDGLAELALGGLDRSAARDLVEGTGVAPVSPQALDRLLDVTGGNPLALLEIPQLLTEAQRVGTEPIDQPLPVGPAVERAFGRRLEQLPEGTRTALLIAAVSASPELDTIERALALESQTLDALLPAENEAMVASEGGRLVFRHPLVRAAVQAQASPAARRAAHAALASALADGPDRDERAWHRALAALGPDDAAAAELEAVGVRAQTTSWRAAARAFEQAAQLTSGGEARGTRLLAAARAAYTGGQLETASRLAARRGTAPGWRPDPSRRGGAPPRARPGCTRGIQACGSTARGGRRADRGNRPRTRGVDARRRSRALDRGGRIRASRPSGGARVGASVAPGRAHRARPQSHLRRRARRARTVLRGDRALAQRRRGSGRRGRGGAQPDRRGTLLRRRARTRPCSGRAGGGACA